MRKTHLFATLLVAGAALGPQAAVAADNPQLARMLTCDLVGDIEHDVKVQNLILNSGRKVGDGSFYFEHPVRNGDVCVDHVTFAAAFGVLMASGTVCDGKIKPLQAALSRVSPQWQPAAGPSRPGVVAAYEAGESSFVIYHGAPGIGKAPEPSSSKISYTCAIRFSGPQ